jgi:hypothetical protein
VGVAAALADLAEGAHKAVVSRAGVDEQPHRGAGLLTVAGCPVAGWAAAAAWAEGWVVAAAGAAAAGAAGSDLEAVAVPGMHLLGFWRRMSTRACHHTVCRSGTLGIRSISTRKRRV